MDKLLALGFIKSAEFTKRSGEVQLAFFANADAKNILYAIVCLRDGQESSDWQVRYVGHAGGESSFGKRMEDYRRGCGDSTNNRVHTAISQHLEQNHQSGKCFAYCMPDHFGMSAQGLHIDVAAGLEKSLIRHYAAFNKDVGHGELVNRAGNTADRLAEAKPAKAANSATPRTFEYLLGKTYWRVPSINVPAQLSNCFGPHGALATAELEAQGQAVARLQTEINRTANVNGTPRLYFSGDDGEEFQNWKHDNFREGDSIKVDITGPDRIRLSEP